MKTFFQGNIISKSQRAFPALFYAIALLLSVLLPIAISDLKLSFISRTYDGSVPGMLDSEPFELFGLFMSIVLIALTWSRFNVEKQLTLKNFLVFILPLLVCLNIIWVIVEESYLKASDYECYENAAQAVVNGLNPYQGNLRCYLYPPLPAQVLAFLYKVFSLNLLFFPGNEAQHWNNVFYIYQCCQFLQIVLAYYLTYCLARRMGLKNTIASLIVSGLFIFNQPLFRTIKFEQINVWILNSFLLALLLLRYRPFLSGLAVALGAHIKLYTLALLLPWSFTKKWRAVVGIIVGFAAILLIQTNWGQDWTLWQQFLVYFRSPERPSNYRNSSIWSLVYNLFKLPARFTGSYDFSFVPTIVAAINLLIVVWFVFRLIERERCYRELSIDSCSPKTEVQNDLFRLYGHSIDAIALGLLISPSVWEHHYVLAIPIALWAIVTREGDQRLLTGIGVFLIFCLPTFDFFPLGHHRMLGLLLLVYLTSPALVQKHFHLAPPKETLL